MSKNRNPELKRKKIIEATHRILQDGGHYTNFSLAKVAQEAGVSKGGLMHHFPTKEALLYAVAQDTVQHFQAAYETRLSQEPATEAGRKTRAYIKAALGDGEPPRIERSPVLLSFLRAGEDDPSAQTRFKHWQAIIHDDGLDEVLAAIIRLVVDGLLYTEVIDSVPLDEDLRQQIRARLLQWVSQGGSPLLRNEN